MRRIRVAVLDFDDAFRSVPTLRCILENFDREGVETDVFCSCGAAQLPDICRARAQPFPIEWRFWSGDVASTLRNWKCFVQFGAWRGSRRLMDGNYDLLIGVNPDGVVAAHAFSRRTGVPFLYLSFELMFRDELRQEGLRRLKAAEMSASRDAAWVVIQDQWRAELLCKENGVPMEKEKMLFLPVAPRGGNLPPRTDYLRARYGIAEEQIVILHAGTLGPFTCGDQLLESLPCWPKRYVLVINTHYAPETSDPYFAKLRSLNLANVRVCQGPLGVLEYEQMVRSADVGIAFYRPSMATKYQGRNIATMGFSSGKIGYYTKNGLPVVMFGAQEYAGMLSRYRFGEEMSRFDQLPDLVGTIMARRSFYSTEAERFFREELDFDRHWPRIWQTIERRLSGHLPDPCSPESACCF